MKNLLAIVAFWLALSSGALAQSSPNIGGAMLPNAVGGSPTGAAGGSLTGTFPNPGLNLAGTNTGVLPAANGGWGSISAWGTTTPTPTCSTGSGTWTGTSISSITINKTTFVSVSIVLSAVGTCSGTIIVALPVTANTGATTLIRENATSGVAFQGWVAPGSANLQISNLTGAGITTLASGNTFIGSFVMQNQ